jgi:acyl-coenzyme A thioesterase PaaI-like protein
MEQRTHLLTSPTWVGRPMAIGDGKASVLLETTSGMAVDEQGLVHGGFVFGLADYAAMLAVNDPNVVLGSADVLFLGPVKVGDRVTAKATVAESNGKKRLVKVSATVSGEEVLSGDLTCFVLQEHVLS